MRKIFAGGFTACLVLCCLFLVSGASAEPATDSAWDFSSSADLSALQPYEGGGEGDIAVENGSLRLTNASGNDGLYASSQYFLNVNAGDSYTLDIRLRIERGMLAVTNRGEPGTVWDNRGYAALFERDLVNFQRRGENFLHYGAADASFGGFVSVRFVVDGWRVRVYFGQGKSSVLSNAADSSGWTSGAVTLTLLNTREGELAEAYLDSVSCRAGCDDAWNPRPLNAVAAYDFSDGDQLADFVRYGGGSGSGGATVEGGKLKLSAGQNLPLYGYTQHFLKGSALNAFTLECSLRVESGVLAISARGYGDQSWENRGYAATFEKKIFRLYRRSQPVVCLAEIEGDFTQDIDFKMEVSGPRVAVYFNGADTFRCANVSEGLFDESYPDGGVNFVSFAGSAGETPVSWLDDVRLYEGVEEKSGETLRTDLDGSRSAQKTAFLRFTGGYQNLGNPIEVSDNAFCVSSVAENIPQYAFTQHDLFVGVGQVLPERYTLSMEVRVASGALGVAHRTSPGDSWDGAGYAAMFESDILRLYQRGPVICYGEYARSFSNYVSVAFQVDGAQVKVYVDGALRLQNTLDGNGDANYAGGGIALVALNRLGGEPAVCYVRNLRLDEGVLVTDGNNVLQSRDYTGAPMDIYVSPSGNDVTGDGSRTNPYLTIQRAQSRARFLQNSPDVTQFDSIRINLENGTYELSDTIRITPEDTAVLPLILRGVESAVVRGGSSFSGGWSAYDAGRGIYRRYLGIEDFRQLYVDGNWGTRARYPNSGAEATFRWLREEKKLTIPVADARNMPKNLEGVECNLIQEWMHDLVFLTGQSDYGAFSSRAALSLREGAAKELLFSQSLRLEDCKGWFENRLEFLDAPNEWYYDSSSGYLYYRPEAGANVNGLVFMTPRLEGLISADGNGVQQVKGLQIQNIIFEGAGWALPGQQGFIDNQSTQYYTYTANGTLTLGRPASVLRLSGCEDTVVKDCFFRNSAATAIDITAGCRDIAILRNTVMNVGGNGISVGYIGSDDVAPLLRGENSLVESVLLQNNTVVSCGKAFLSGTGIFASYVRDIEVLNNHITTVPYSGIALGWGWESSAQQTRLGRFRVENNLVEYAMNSIARDGAGIYVLGAHDGNDESSVSGNLVRMVGGLGLIYLDNSSSNWRLEDNVLVGVGDYGCLFFNDTGNLLRRIRVGRTFATSEDYRLDSQTDPALTPQSQRQITFAGITLLTGAQEQWPAAAREIAENAGVFAG